MKGEVGAWVCGCVGGWVGVCVWGWVGGWVGGDEGDAGTNDCRGATSSSSNESNEKLFVAMRADDERERLERMWEEVGHCQMCVG